MNNIKKRLEGNDIFDLARALYRRRNGRYDVSTVEGRKLYYHMVYRLI